MDRLCIKQAFGTEFRDDIWLFFDARGGELVIVVVVVLRYSCAWLRWEKEGEDLGMHETNWMMLMTNWVWVVGWVA